MLRVNKSYTRHEWKSRYNELQTTMQQLSDTQLQEKTQCQKEIMELKLNENHDEYWHQPDKLLARLITDVRNMCDNADDEYLFSQSIETRLFIIRIRSTINTVQERMHQVTSSPIEANQNLYDTLCNELSFYASELHFKRRKTTYNALNTLLEKYFIPIPIILRSSLTQEDFHYVREIECTNYHKAVKELETTLSRLTPAFNTVKTDTNNFIEKIESARLKKGEKTKPSSDDSAFDYTRHTHNLKKTNELLKNPFDTSVQNAYAGLIKRNHSLREDTSCMKKILIGTVLTCIGLLLCSFPPTLYIGALLTAVGLHSVISGVVEKENSPKKTERYLSSIFKDVKHIRPDTPITVDEKKEEPQSARLILH